MFIVRSYYIFYSDVDCSEVLVGAGSQVCRAFKGAGCCTQAFFTVLRAMYQYACQEMSHSLETAIKSVTTDCQLPVQFGGIGEKFPSPCEGFPSMDYSAYDPATCPADSHGFWHDIKDTCGYGQYLVCPNSMCGLGCMSQAVLDDISPKVDEKKHRSPAQQAFEDKHGHFTINIPTNAIIPRTCDRRDASHRRVFQG